MRQRFIQHPETLELIPAEEYVAPGNTGPFIQADYQPYKSMVTGEMIEGRAAHREHLKRHNVVEVGTAYDKELPKPKPLTSPKGLKETIARAAYEKLRYQ